MHDDYTKTQREQDIRQEIRLSSLHLAHHPGDEPEEVVKRAEAYRRFIMGEDQPQTPET